MELFRFLGDERLDVRHMACKYVAGLSRNREFIAAFKTDHCQPINALMALVLEEEPLTQHDALSALINLTSFGDSAILDAMANDQFLTDLVVRLMLPSNVNADLCCMLLNNMSKHQAVVALLLQHHIRTDNLLQLFGLTTEFKATFHFLAGVFANLSAIDTGFFLQNSTVDQSLRLSKIVVFTEHPDPIRRGGVISTIKNCCHHANATGAGFQVLLDPDLELLDYILLPLSGSEDYTEEEMEGMSEALQLLEPSKKRESDARLRLMLVESLLLLTATPHTRNHLRSVKVYPVVRKMHLSESNDDIKEMIERLVNMLMRDEETNEAIER